MSQTKVQVRNKCSLRKTGQCMEKQSTWNQLIQLYEALVLSTMQYIWETRRLWQLQIWNCWRMHTINEMYEAGNHMETKYKITRLETEQERKHLRLFWEK